MIVEFSKKLLATLDEDIASNVQALADGRVTDYAGYRELVGKLRGLALAREHIQERTRAYTEDK